MINISSSKMDLFYNWCKRKYRLRYIENIPTPFVAPALRLGSICHDEIKVFWKNYQLNLITYEQDLDKYYNTRVNIVRKQVLNSKLDEESFIKFQIYFDNFIQFQKLRIDRYIEIYGKNLTLIKKYFYPVLNENYGKLLIARNIQFSFILDALFRIENKMFLLVDWKTDKNCSLTSFKSHIPQLNRYSNCIPIKFNYPCHKIGIYFLAESKFFSKDVNINYSLEKDVLKFVRDIQKSKFPKVDKKEKYKCCAKNYHCEYYPNICGGSV